MKILVIDNSTFYLEHIKKALTGHDVEVQKYHPGLDFHDKGKDLIILSGGGGEGQELNDAHTPGHLWYEDEIKFVKSCKKPIIGICMGFEIIARAFGEKVEKVDQYLEKFAPVHATPIGARILGHKNLSQFEAHTWGVKKVSPERFEVLAGSHYGIEMFRHKTRPIIATQFHPEFPGGTLKLQNLLNTI